MSRPRHPLATHPDFERVKNRRSDAAGYRRLDRFAVAATWRQQKAAALNATLDLRNRPYHGRSRNT